MTNINIFKVKILTTVHIEKNLLTSSFAYV